MSDNKPTPQPLDPYRAKLAARIEAADKVESVIGELKGVVESTKAVVATDIELARMLASAIRAVADSVQPEYTEPSLARGFGIGEGLRETAISMEASSAFDRICEFFWARDNKPATVGEIISATRASAAAVRQLIYKRRRDQFVKVIDPRVSESVRYKLAELTARLAGSRELKVDEAEP